MQSSTPSNEIEDAAGSIHDILEYACDRICKLQVERERLLQENNQIEAQLLLLKNKKDNDKANSKAAARTE